MGYAQLEYCLTSDDKVKLDFLDIFFVVVLVSLATVTVSSSYYDKSLRKTRATPDEQNAHYKLSVGGPSEWNVVGGDSNANWTSLSSELSRVLFVSPQLAPSHDDSEERH